MTPRDTHPTSEHLSLARQLAATAQHLAATDDPRLSTLVARVYAETDRIAAARSTFEAAIAHAELLFSRRSDDGHSTVEHGERPSALEARRGRVT